MNRYKIKYGLIKVGGGGGGEGIFFVKCAEGFFRICALEMINTIMIIKG